MKTYYLVIGGNLHEVKGTVDRKGNLTWRDNGNSGYARPGNYTVLKIGEQKTIAQKTGEQQMKDK